MHARIHKLFRYFIPCMQSMKSKCSLLFSIWFGHPWAIDGCVCVDMNLNIKPVKMTVSLNEIIPSTLTRQKVAMQTLLHHSLIGNFETGNFFFLRIYFIVDWNFVRFWGLCYVCWFSFTPNACLFVAFYDAISLQIDLAVWPLFSYQTEFYRCSLINTNTLPLILSSGRNRKKTTTATTHMLLLLSSSFIVGCTMVRPRNALSIFGKHWKSG